jgi:hypothetical protein
LARGGSKKQHGRRPPARARALDPDAVEELVDELELELPREAAESIRPLLEAVARDEVSEADLAAAAEATWTDDVRREVESALLVGKEQTLELLGDLVAALDEVRRPARQNLLARELALRAAEQAHGRAMYLQHLMQRLETELASAPEEDRRSLALELELPLGEPGFARAELLAHYPQWVDEADAAASSQPTWFARALATDERRRALRDDLAAKAATLGELFPTAAATLATLAGEPLPADPADDVLWLRAVEDELGLRS